MIKRKPAYRRNANRQNRFAMLLVTIAVVMLMAVVGISSIGLREKKKAYAAREAALESQIEAEMQRTEEIEEFRRYTKTLRYKEEVAKDKLGMVYEGEIIFQEK